ncbi:ribonuclease Oy isoform X1 [Apis laboriosa]|uniref:ribonuclease Oy isoform X1 n=1 Tax=Apis laboriosa TaxID=183418 RepID=UPI001CC69945|nr:ribonuclease Oy isoform X1 [Apis laboriosa]XP_043802313.1 ribonuclease Oy isoform X1 [Apis laboriosa]
MLNCKKFAIILFLFFIGKVNSKSHWNRIPRSNNDFDVLIFTQHWPQTVCFTWKEKSTSNTCSLPKEHDEWTIHGIWPSQYHKIGPQFCNKLPFNSTALEPLKEELQEKWIDIEKGRTSYSFWQHEWDKHGTCAVVLKELNTENKYFAKGLELLSTYNMKNVLTKANIIPGQTYNKTEILNAIEQQLNTRGILICQENKHTGESYIFEIRICFNKTLELSDCTEINEYPTNCKSERIIYPKKVPYNTSTIINNNIIMNFIFIFVLFYKYI